MDCGFQHFPPPSSFFLKKSVNPVYEFPCTRATSGRIIGATFGPGSTSYVVSCSKSVFGVMCAYTPGPHSALCLCKPCSSEKNSYLLYIWAIFGPVSSNYGAQMHISCSAAKLQQFFFKKKIASFQATSLAGPDLAPCLQRRIMYNVACGSTLFSPSLCVCVCVSNCNRISLPCSNYPPSPPHKTLDVTY